MAPPCARPEDRPGDRRDAREARDRQVLLVRFLLNAQVEVILDSEVD
jgi:hypothetical protein